MTTEPLGTDITSRTPFTYQYTPASRFRENWMTSARLLPICLAPIVAKMLTRPDLRPIGFKTLGMLGIGLFLFGLRQFIIRKRVYDFAVNEECVTYSVNGILVSSIRWQDVTKVNDGDPYYVKLNSASRRSIEIDYTMSIYGLTRRFITEKVPSRKVRYMRFWIRPIRMVRDIGLKSRPRP